MTSNARKLVAATLLFALLVLPVALAGAAGDSGGRRATAGASVKNTVKKLKKKLNAQQQQLAEFEQQLAEFEATPGPAGPEGPPGPSTGPAGGDLTGTYPDPLIGPDAVGPDEIADPNRSVNLPLTSFVNPDASTLDFTPSDGTSPDFNVVSSHVFIEWDDDSDGGGGNIADTDLIQTTFTVPPDFAAGGSFALRMSKDAHTTGVGERVFCQKSVDAGSFAGGQANVTISTAAITSYTFNPFGGGSLSPGATVELRCSADNGVSGTTADDAVRMHSAEFRYFATQ